MNTVILTLRDPLHIRIECEDYDYIRQLKRLFTYYVDGFQFTPQYKSGSWNGRVCLITASNTMPYGLLTEFLKINKKNFPDAGIVIDPEIKKLFKGPDLNIVEDLSLIPYPYQRDCIEKALQYTKGIIRSSTASGKSLIISYILKTLLENNITQQNIIIVPNKSLVEQFYNDMIDYGISSKWSVGRVYSKEKQWDKNIVISTWQTLMRNHDKLKQYDCVIADECHGVRSIQLKRILLKSVRASYRLGFTGTMHADKLDVLNTCSYLGPIIADYSSGELAEQGYIAKCSVNVINIEYSEPPKGNYNEVKDEVFRNPYRLSVIKYLINKSDHNVLMLVSKVEKEGDYLKEWLEGVINKEIVFLSGRDNVDIREKWRKKCMKRKDIALIATYPLFAQGINIPNLKYVMFASPLMSKIKVLQSIGRSLRKHADKKNGAILYDIHDHTKYLEKHGNVRFRYYGSEGFDTNEVMLEEGDRILL
jgi:superfamily II DNA or RNA helicase